MGKYKPKKVREYMSRVAEMGCIICGSPCQLHHPRHNIGMGQKSSDMDVIPLCQFHHTGGFSIHMNKKAFEAKYGSEERLLKKVKEYMKAVYA
jgi:hypothetical protein